MFCTFFLPVFYYPHVCVSRVRSTATPSVVCLCNSCVEMQNCLTCGGASETRKSWRAWAAGACLSSLLLPSPSCSQLGLWPTSFLSPSLSELWSSSPTPTLSPVLPQKPDHNGCPSYSPSLFPSPTYYLSLTQLLCDVYLPTFLPPCSSPRAPFLPHLQVVWRSGVCLGGRALVRPTGGGCQGTWCFLRGSMDSPGPAHPAVHHVLLVSALSPLRRSVSRLGCFVDAETGASGPAADPQPRSTSSLGPLCCWQSRVETEWGQMFFN